MFGKLCALTGIVCGLITLLITVTVLGARLSRSPEVAQRLNACGAPCNWPSMDLSGLSAGDFVAAFGAPAEISFTDLGGLRRPLPRGVSTYRATLVFPDWGLALSVDNWEDAARIGPSARHHLVITPLTRRILMGMRWRGFARLCRYYPQLAGICVSD